MKQGFRLGVSGAAPAVAAAFTWGCEEVISDLFCRLTADLEPRFPGQLGTFTHYPNRRMELNEDHHAPLAHQMVP